MSDNLGARSGDRDRDTNQLLVALVRDVRILTSRVQRLETRLAELGG